MSLCYLTLMSNAILVAYFYPASSRPVVASCNLFNILKIYLFDCLWNMLFLLSCFPWTIVLFIQSLSYWPHIHLEYHTLFIYLDRHLGNELLTYRLLSRLLELWLEYSGLNDIRKWIYEKTSRIVNNILEIIGEI